MPTETDRCVESVLEDNPDMDTDRAWAVCKAQQEGVDTEAVESPPVDPADLTRFASERPLWSMHYSAEYGMVWIDGAEDVGVMHQAAPDDATVAAFIEAEGADSIEQQAGASNRVAGRTVVVDGLSDEAIEAIETRYNADVTVKESEDTDE